MASAETTSPTNDATAARAYGTLATSLNETVAEARGALEGHAGLLPTGRLAELDELLAEFARRRVRIALYGEVKAGKSTLLNALAGTELSPSAFEPLTNVPVHVTWGAGNAWRVGDRAFQSASELARAMREDTTLGGVLVETPLDLLQLGGQVDLLDTPGVGSEERLDEVSATVLRSLDAVVLVVRYPALFTQFTRHLMQRLEGDIGKLFVVWNLDADCAELTPEERGQHAETLRRNVAGANELFLVDAREGLRAAQRGDQAAAEAAGLASFVEAVARFAGSDKRQVAALRQAVKRSTAWLAEASAAMSRRQAEVGEQLAGIRKRLQVVQEAEAKEAAGVRGKHAELQAAVQRIGAERGQKAEAIAAAARKQLDAARRLWIKGGDAKALEASVHDSMRLYADGVKACTRDACQAAIEAAKRFETVVDPKPRPRVVPTIPELAPADRLERGLVGRLKGLRRRLWKRWYLPGLEELSTRGLADDLATQAGWFEGVASDVAKASGVTLQRKLGEVASRAREKSEAIRLETGHDALEAESQALAEHLPVVAAGCEQLEEIGRQGRTLFG